MHVSPDMINNYNHNIRVLDRTCYNITLGTLEKLAGMLLLLICVILPRGIRFIGAKQITFKFSVYI